MAQCQAAFCRHRLVQLLNRSPTQYGAEVDACLLQQQQPPDWQRRPTWASEWAAQHALQSGAVQQSGGGNGGSGGGSLSGAFDSMNVAGGGGSDTPMRSMAYLQQQELRYISAGI